MGPPPLPLGGSPWRGDGGRDDARTDAFAKKVTGENRYGADEQDEAQQRERRGPIRRGHIMRALRHAPAQPTKPFLLCEPSQNGFLSDSPQRHSNIVVALHSRPSMS